VFSLEEVTVGRRVITSLDYSDCFHCSGYKSLVQRLNYFKSTFVLQEPVSTDHFGFLTKKV